MTDLLETIRGRRSIRKYEETPVPEDTLDRILEAVRWAPSWTNCQPWELVVVRDPEVKSRLQETVYPKNPAVKAVGNAPVVIAVCGRTGVSGFYDGKASTKFGDWFLFDLGIATQNLCLAAHEAGLGTVVVGLLDHDAAARVLSAPAGTEVAALIPLGVPAKISKAPARREISEFAHADRFSEK
ncbi:MAG: nitroreductase family protein [Desulfococcaceae bacterium]